MHAGGSAILLFDVVFAAHTPVHGQAPRCSARAVCRYMVVYDVRPWVMKLWVPLVWFMVAALVIAIEVRIFVGYTAGI